MQYGAAIAVLAAAVAACGSSSKTTGSGGSGGGASSTPSTSSAPSASSSPSSASPSSASPSERTVALPAPCSLLTVADAQPFFGTTELSVSPSSGVGPGVAQCTYNLKVGVQAKQIGIRTLTDYANNPAYIFPNSDVTPVPGLGYPAVLNTHVSGSVNQSTLTVKLGKNALEIHIEWYTDPVNNTLLTQLAKDALGRL